MTLQYQKINLKNIEDFKIAEVLQTQGWKAVANGVDYILMEREAENKEKK